MEDPERRDQARKRKKWKQNLSITDEEDQSSDSDVQNKTTSTFETNDAIALRFPYPMISDDSDDDYKDLSFYPKVSPNTDHVNKYTTVALLSDDNIESSNENESFKHKKRKTNHKKENHKISRTNNVQKVMSPTCKGSALLTNKQQKGKQTLTKKKCKSYRSSSSKVSKADTTSSTVSSKNCNIPQTEKNFTIIQKAGTSKIQAPTIVKFEPENSWPTIDDNERQVSTTRSSKRTSCNTRNKAQKNKANSRFLDSSSEEEVVTKKPVRGHSKFKRIHLMSSSSSSSDDEELNHKVKKERTRFLSTSSSSNDEVESIDNNINELQTEEPGPDISQTMIGLRKNNQIHSFLSSSDSENSKEYHFLQKKNNSKNSIKETSLLCSSIEDSNKSPVSQNNVDTEENPNCVNPGEVGENQASKTKNSEIVPCKSHVNKEVWKNIASVQFKRPKSSSTHHQSYLQTLKKQFISSNIPSVEIHRKIIDKTLCKSGDIKSSKESCSSKTRKEDITGGERLNINDLPSYAQSLPCETSTSDNNQGKQQPIDLNINMNVQIICSPSFEENMNSVENSISKPPVKTNKEAPPPESGITFSMTQQENKKTEISSCKNIKYSVERNSSNKAKHNDSNKFKCNTQHQRKLLKYNQTKHNSPKEGLLNTEKKVIISESRNKVFTENNESPNDLLSNILLEMDSNPFNVKKVLSKKVLEPSAEMHERVSLTPHLNSTLSQSHLPVNLQSTEKENQSTHHKNQVENKQPTLKLAFSKQANVAVTLSDKSPSISQIGSNVNKLENSIKNFQESKQQETPLVQDPNSSEKNVNNSLPKLISSFYSVNSEDYNRPHNEPNDKNKERNNHFHYSLVANTLPELSKLATVAVSSSDKSPSNSQIGSSTNKLENSINNFQESKQQENSLVQDPNSFEENTGKPLSTLITSFYSVNSEDYNRPHEEPNMKSIKSNSHLIASTSNLDDASQLQILNNHSKTSPCKEIMKGNHLIGNKKESIITEVDQFSQTASNKMSTSHDDSSGQPNVYAHCMETEPRQLENKSSAERNLKYLELVQCTIDNLTKGLPKNMPSKPKKGLVCEETKNISFRKSSNNSHVGNTVLNFSKESTTPLEVGSINHCAASNKEAKQCPDKENNIISDSKPSKGIRIRFGGNVYRLPGKENANNSNVKAKKQKEIILSTMIDSKNQKATNISPNNRLHNNNTSSPFPDNRESDSSKSSSSSEDSSSDSSSSEDRLVVSEKSSSRNSLSENTSEDEKKVSAEVQSMAVSSKISTEGEINNDKEAKHISTNLHNARPSSTVSKLNEPPKINKKSFSLDELLGFHEKTKPKACLTVENSCNVISNDMIVLSSSSEGESIESTTNSVSKPKGLDIKSCTVVDENSQKNSTKTSDDKSKDQNSILRVPVENKGWKIRVRSSEELGISTACPLPDNALSSRLVAVEPKGQSLEDQSLPTNALNVLNPTSSKKIDSVAKKKSIVQTSPLKRKASFLKEGTERQNLKRLRLLQNEVIKTVNELNFKQLNSSAIKTPLPNKKVVPKGNAKTHLSNKNFYNISTNKCLSKQPGFSKQTISSQFNAFKTNDESTNNLCFPHSEAVANQAISGPSETRNTVTNPTTVVGPIPKGTVLAVARVPTESQTTTENRTSTVATLASCSTSDRPQKINNPLSESTVKDSSVETPDLNESIDPNSQPKLESQFFKLCDELFCEVVMMKIPKLIDDLHLVIAHDIMRQERLKKVDQLKCPETKEEEKRRTEKEFTEMLKIRGQGFVPLFMTIVRKIENKENLRTVVLAFYCKIIHQLEQIDQINHTYRFKLRFFIQKMLLKSSINHKVCDIFGDSDINFTTHFYFIEGLLFKYDQFVAKRSKKGIHSVFDENDKDATVQKRSQTENSDKRDNSNSTNSQVGRTTVIISGAEPSTSEQTAKTIHMSNNMNVQAQPSGRSNPSNVNLITSFGNLDQMLLGSFLKKSTGREA